jgi:DNA-binding response OmpR family regulator
MKKILIIEDDTVLRENTAEFIKANFEVFIAEDGLVGVQQTLKHLPDPSFATYPCLYEWI